MTWLRRHSRSQVAAGWAAKAGAAASARMAAQSEWRSGFTAGLSLFLCGRSYCADATDAPLHRRARPGHHQHALHPLQPRRRGACHRPARACPALSAARLGGTRRRRDLAQRAGGHGRGAGNGFARTEGPRRHRHHQPARDHRAVEPAHGRAHPPRAGLAGHAGGIAGGAVRARWRSGSLPRAHRPAAGELLQRAEDPVAARPGARCAGGGGSWRAAVRHHGQLDGVEHDRRRRGRPACHRRDQRQPHAADEPRDAGLGRCAAGCLPHPAGAVAADCFVQRTDWRCDARFDRWRSNHRHSRRSAGRAGGPDLLRDRRSEEHLRHRLLPADEHREPRSCPHARA